MSVHHYQPGTIPLPRAVAVVGRCQERVGPNFSQRCVLNEGHDDECFCVRATPLALKPPAMHRARVVRNDGKWQARCSCGWQGAEMDGPVAHSVTTAEARLHERSLV